MKMFALLITLSIIIASCKKNNSLTTNPPPSDTCGERYDKEYFSSVKTNPNIFYSRALNISGVQEDLYMDVYEPEDDTVKKRAMIIFVHGGGWVARAKDDGKDFCTLLAKKGYVAGSINYRLGIENPVNEKTRGEAIYRGVQDIKAAVRYVRANASLFKIDTAQIFIGGYSAGAVNAVHAAYWDESEVPGNIDKERWGDLEAVGGNPGFSSAVEAVYSIAGFIADTSFIQSEEAAIVCVHSKTDNLIPYNSGFDYLGIFVYGSTPILEKATSVNVPATLFTFESIHHGAYLAPDNLNTTTNAVTDFLYSQVKCR